MQTVCKILMEFIILKLKLSQNVLFNLSKKKKKLSPKFQCLILGDFKI